LKKEKIFIFFFSFAIAWTCKMRSTFLFAAAFLAVFASVVFGANEIKSLPGVQFDIKFKHYSGYLQVSPTHFLHYWFVESQNNPARDPLIFWFNGGPGCSSLDGLLNEMGPYEVNPDGKTMRSNSDAWNTFASVVYIESPAGVGYSYSSDGNTTTNDDLTSLENYEGVKKFFELHPTFRNHSTFIMGESYGGVYVPTLTARIVDGQKDFPVNLRGMALGNGYVNEKLNVDTSVRFAYGHGLIDEKLWNTLERECCRGCIDDCDLTKMTGHCAHMVEDIFKFLWFGGLNPYDLYRDCDPNPDTNSVRMSSYRAGIIPRIFLQSTLKHKDPFKKRFPSYGASVPCLNDTDLLTYMNDKAVRAALHIPENLPKWDICSEEITEKYQKQYTDMSPFIKKIVNSGVRVLLYYGDTDMACNFMMGQQFAAQLGYPRQLNKTPWKYNKQIAGFKTLYKGVTFITIRGAGHMAPQWRAPETKYAIQQFVINHPI
jgi:cathepsin A (carboxypeptidase C)